MLKLIGKPAFPRIPLPGIPAKAPGKAASLEILPRMGRNQI